MSYFRDYYSRDKYANLPPGLRKHVLKTGHLPAQGNCHQDRKEVRVRTDAATRLLAISFPSPQCRLPKSWSTPPDSKLYLYGDDVILLNDHTKAIIDILRGAYCRPRPADQEDGAPC